MNSLFLAVPGYEGSYEVSDIGEVRSLDRYVGRGYSQCLIKGRILKQTSTSTTGHLEVELFKESKGWRVGVHRLVLLAFIGPCPDEMQCCHWDDVPTNNVLSNLRWGTQAENMLDRRRVRGTDINCPRGHPRNETNLFMHSTGALGCRSCYREVYNVRWMQKKRNQNVLGV